MNWRNFIAKSSIRFRATALTLIVIVVALGIAAGTSTWQTSNLVVEGAHREAAAMANSLAKTCELPLAVKDKAELSRLAGNSLWNRDTLFVAVYDNKGKLMALATRDSAAWGRYVQKHRAGDDLLLGEATVFLSTAADEFSPLDAHDRAAAPASPAGPGAAPSRAIGCVVLGNSTVPIRQAQQRQVLITVAMAVLAAGIVCGIMLWAVTRWTRRLGLLVQASEGISRGDLSHAVPDTRPDEIGRLCQAFEGMRLAVQQRDIELRRFNDTLQEQVRQRTSDLVAAKEVAEEANKAKSEFLANMSHEIRTPLTAILGYSEMLMDEGTSPQERKEHSLVILRNGKHLLNLVNDILDISKIEADKLVLERRPCSIHAIVADVVSMMRVRAIEKHLTLTARYVTPMPWTILTDEARLRQALINLVGNAIKFTSTGEVSISISLVQGQQDIPPMIQVDVHDTGIGISAEAIKSLFRPFTQADSSTTRKFGGTGLGLTITKRIIEKMGGQVQVQSTPGQGSTFTLVVPTGPLEGIAMVEHTAEAMAETTEAPHQPERTHPLEGLRILLAEDGPDNQLLIRTVLSKAGAEVEVVENGLLAVQAATARPFDLVLMDMQMPEMDGYEATGQLRAKGYEAPIVALTAHALSSDRARCIDAGCTDYLTKPIDRAALIALILKHTFQPATARADISEMSPEMLAQKPSSPAVAAIASQFADDPDMAEVIASFVRQLPDRCQSMREALKNGDLPTLQRLAHQMKGAGGSYGYPMLTQAGKELESAVKAGDQEACGLKLHALAVMCQAVGRGRKTKEISREPS